MKAVILAGGSGERFWPLSNSKKPKQFLKLFSDKSLIRETYERLLDKMNPADIYIVTSENYYELTKQEIPEINEKNLILEPIPRNTAPACMLGTLVAEENEIVTILPADHFIPNKDAFWDTLNKGIEAASKYIGLFTLGITPTRPETGYGYIEVCSELEPNIFKVKSFKEKPDQQTAKTFIEKGNFFWNSGIFIWKKEVFLKEMEHHAYEIYEQLINIDPFDIYTLKEIYPNVKKISIDYALMEKSKNIYVIKTDLLWSDVGNWVSVRELTGYSDDSKNVHIIDGENVFVKTDKKVGVIGLSNIVVVESEEGILITTEEKAQKVRNISQKFKDAENI
ncbi:MAG TPA: mannose-1-phosphate guanylyltransferase [Defluviitoga sp.]|nr:mannose-1-phosphate guanylyltransferase [Defluviitoga sp.]HOP25422.1 mannose-1-phosphate guanylyltransferase [Defluviitoga sp.]HPZ28285.1 mannose-1-phosphate guanylyltransferase [Defluviitoga sp.]HQD62175.1 mannose-1-phosphate guanylyltransferase [Defluviitoga sp.]